ncbi:MAG: hypothetical protein U0R50_03380 [Gaiellales bacterium]
MRYARNLAVLALLALGGFVAADQLIAAGQPQQDDPVGRLTPVSVTVGRPTVTQPPVVDHDRDGDDD